MVEPTRAGVDTGVRASYRAAGFFLLRVPTLPVEEVSSLGREAHHRRLNEDDLPIRLARSRSEGRAHLHDVAARPRVMQALHVATSSLTAGLARLGSYPPGHKKTASVYSPLLRYITRMAIRPTPYGLFSAVGIGTFETSTSLVLDAGPLAGTWTRSNVGWLLALIKKIEDDEDLVESLRVTVNPMLYRVGDRAVLSFADVHGQADNRMVGFRVTKPAEIALDMAAIPGVTYADIVEGIYAAVPGATAERARGLVAQMWRLHVLTSDLRPALTVSLPEQDLVKRLDGIKGCAAIQTKLRHTRALAGAVDATRGSADISTLEELTAHQRQLTPEYTRESYQLDSTLAMAGTGLSIEVAETAAEAAEVLMRLGSEPQRRHHIVEYHNAFLERYGLHAEVPVLELLSPELGLEAPATYSCPPRSYPLPSVPVDDTRPRNAALLALVAEALHQGAPEIELTDARLERSAVWRPEPAHPRARPSLDLYIQLAATSRAALDRGDWRMVVAPGTTTDGGRTFGRFFDLFSEESLARLAEYARAEEALCPDVVFTELSYVPPHGRSGNVMIHPPLRRHEICVNTSPSVAPEGQIPLADILVGAMKWRRAWQVPRYVYLVWADNRLLLDLEHPLCVDELNTELRRALGADRKARLVLHGMLPDLSHLWLDHREGHHYLNEIVVPLLARDESLVRRHAIGAAVGPDSETAERVGTDPSPSRVPATVHGRRKLVGSEWVYLKLYSAASQHDDLIIGPVPELIEGLQADGLIDRWFYIRYFDSQPHLRLRMHVDRLADVPQVMALAIDWSRELVAAGLASDLAFVSYDRETERYGGPAVIDIVEGAFEANSDVSVGLLDLLRRHAGDLEPEVVCLLAMHVLCRYWGQDPVRDIRPGEELKVSDTVRKQFRKVQPTLCDLLEPWDDHPDPRARSHMDALHGVLERQRSVIAATGARVRELSADRRLGGSESTVLGSLVHMQVNRLLGMDPDRERSCHELWSLARRSIQRRPAKP